MQIRPLTLFTAKAAVAVVVVAGCEATLHARAPFAHLHATPDLVASQYQPVSQPQPEAQPPSQAQGTPRPQPGELLVEAMAPSRGLNADSFAALQARVQQAINDAAAGGANLSVAILDRVTHHMLTNGNNQVIGTASVAKLFIADEALLHEAQGKAPLSPEEHKALDVMLKSSDDDAAERFWGQGGGDAIVTAVANRYGLTSTTPPSDGRWWNTMSSLQDLIRYYDMLLDGTGGLPPERATMILNDLAQSTPNGADGYPQRFGIPDGLYGEPVAVKQGWMCCIGPDWMHLSTGLIGADHRYIMVVQSLQPSDDVTARDTITRAVKTIFPSGRV